MNTGRTAVINDDGMTEVEGRPAQPQNPLPFQLTEVNLQTGMTTVALRSDVLELVIHGLKLAARRQHENFRVNQCKSLANRLRIAESLQFGDVEGDDISDAGRPYREIAVNFVG